MRSLRAKDIYIHDGRGQTSGGKGGNSPWNDEVPKDAIKKKKGSKAVAHLATSPKG